MSSLYFDNNATTIVDPEVIQSMQECWGSQLGNPSSNHSFGRKAHRLVEEARIKVANAVGALPKEVFFTSSGSESNNWFVNGMAKVNPDAKFFYGATEHPCISKPMQQLQNIGIFSEVIPVKTSGEVDETFFKKLNNNDINIVSLMYVNNESGVIHDLKKIKENLGSNVLLHSDAVQALGKIKLEFNDLNLDAMSISSHKVNGPQGIAALVIKNGLDIEPLIYGGGQESGLRSGTENIASIVGFGKACELAKEKLKKTVHLKELRDFFEKNIKLLGGAIFAEASPRVSNTSFFGFPNIDGATLITALDKHGIGIASGSACSSNNKEPSHVLLAMGIEDQQAQSAVRLSLGDQNTKEDIVFLLEKIKLEVNRLLTYTSILN